MQRKDLKNQIEQITPSLYEIGDRLIRAADRINEQKAVIAEIKANLANAEGWLEKDRDRLFKEVKKHYIDSEIETADTWRTQINA